MLSRTNLAYNSKTEYEFYNVQRNNHNPNLRIKNVRRDEEELLAQKRQHKREQVAKRKARLFMFVVAFAAFMVLCRGVMITEKCNTVEKKRNELESIITHNEKTQLEIDRALNLDTVEEVATTKLNMRRPEKHQTVYIKINQDEFVEKTDSSGVSEAVTGFFDTLKAYLD